MVSYVQIQSSGAQCDLSYFAKISGVYTFLKEKHSIQASGPSMPDDGQQTNIQKKLYGIRKHFTVISLP